MSRRFACLVALLGLSACAGLPGSGQSLGTEAVTPVYAAGGGRFDDGATLIFLTRVFEQAGRVGLCGVRTAHSTTGRTRLFNEQVAGAAAVTVVGDTVLHGLRGLPEARYREDMTGATARCLLTDRPWRPEYAAAAPEIRIPRLQFPDGDGGGLGGIGWGESVVFRGAPVHRPLP